MALGFLMPREVQPSLHAQAQGILRDARTWGLWFPQISHDCRSKRAGLLSLRQGGCWAVWRSAVAAALTRGPELKRPRKRVSAASPRHDAATQSLAPHPPLPPPPPMLLPLPVNPWLHAPPLPPCSCPCYLIPGSTPPLSPHAPAPARALLVSLHLCLLEIQGLPGSGSSDVGRVSVHGWPQIIYSRWAGSEGAGLACSSRLGSIHHGPIRSLHALVSDLDVHRACQGGACSWRPSRSSFCPRALRRM